MRVRWRHDNPDCPIWLYSELDDDGWESRKVDVYADGHQDYAGPGEEHGIGLGPEPIPPIEEMAPQAEFEPEAIDQAAFERVWAARASALPPGRDPPA